MKPGTPVSIIELSLLLISFRLISSMATTGISDHIDDRECACQLHQCSRRNAAYVPVNLAGSGYPASYNVIVTTAQAGSVALLGCITPGTVVQSVVVTDGAGNVVAVGN